MSNIPAKQSPIKKYSLLIWSSILMLIMVLAFIFAEQYLSRKYSQTFDRYTAFSSVIDMHKDLIIGMQAVPDENYTPEERAKLAEITYATFDQIQKFYPSYINGGTAKVGYITPVTLEIPPPTDAKDLKLVTALNEKWNELFVATHDPIIRSFKGVTAQDIVSNSPKYMQIKIEAEKEVKNWVKGFVILDKIHNNLLQKIHQIEQQQIYLTGLGILGLLLYFMVIGYLNFRKLVTSDRKLEVALKENEDILNTVDSGLFLLDKDLKIGSQHSKALKGILLEDNIGGKNLSELLEGIVSKQDVETTGEFIQQLYNPRVKAKLINDLNPLRKINVSLTNKDGSVENKFLDFGFSRIYDNGEISHILVTANDITKSVYLEKRLETERRQNDEQTQMITTILNSDIRMVREFVKNAQSSTTKINEILKDSSKGTKVFDKKLTQMFREAHSLKGEASALDLKVVTKQVTNLEENIKQLQQKTSLTGDDFLPLTVRLDDIIETIKTIGMLSKRLGVMQSTTNPNFNGLPKAVDDAVEDNTLVGVDAVYTNHKMPAQTDLVNGNTDIASNKNQTIGAGLPGLQAKDPSMSFDLNETQNATSNANSQLNYQQVYYKNFVEQLAKRGNKLVYLKTKGIEDLDAKTNKHKILKEIALQLLRNAVTHGIEAPGARMAHFKNEEGQIKLTFVETDDKLTLSVEDDGNGIDYAAIKRKAINSGKYNVDDVENWSKKKLLALIFSSGFSTADNVTEDAGQGVGLDVVKSRIVDIGAKLVIDTEAGKFTRFTIVCDR